MNRRAFLTSSLLAAPALLTLSGLPAVAATTGSTLLEAPGVTASGSFTIPGFGPGGNGRLAMTFSNGPGVQAQFGPNAISRIVAATPGSRIGIHYTGLGGAGDYVTRWTLNSVAAGGASAGFDVDGGVSANVSALVGGDQHAGSGLAAMIVAAVSGGAVLRNAGAAQLQALVTPRATPQGADFGLDVTVSAA
ncbi:hypothetical protein HKCCE4037_16850 [Rhodobacterales bacterium HKCCE4037]|nr:hypothetical protein [Rhodobacterales bacterium HKCCE4037]